VLAKSAPSFEPLIELLEIIKIEINRRGAIPFEDFMRLALYCPVYGFYEKEEDTIGRNGDFYTSVSVGNLFGELLAFQFAEWLEECQSETRPVQIVEAGAHRGALARDIVIWFRDHRPELFQSLQYWIIEPSSTRQKWQSATLAEFSAKISWFSRITDPSSVAHLAKEDHASRINGVIFANELLDAMPVRRFGWDAKGNKWFEWGVTLKNGGLAWTRLDRSSRPKKAGRFGVFESPFPPFETNEQLLSVLPDNFTFETCPEAEAWWQSAARGLDRGRLVTIDYGMTTDELVLPERKHGTLRGYYRHHPTSDLLANPGEQDLTAHVNFSALIAAGEANGLKTEKFETQTQFLTRLASQVWNGEAAEQWNPARTRQFQTLTHPEYLGRNFRVLVQSRGATI
jgi:SAM-dependent MidA family methyltransferase